MQKTITGMIINYP